MSAVANCIEYYPRTSILEQAHWYAVQTHSRHERLVSAQLREQGLTTFLPLITRVQRWSDRRKLVEFPLFSGYIFVYALRSPQMRRTVLFTRGVAGFVAMQGEPLPIPDEQIDSIREILDNNVHCVAHPFLKVGQRVRIRGGSLEGLVGILVGRNRETKLVISVDAIQRSFSIQLEGYDVEVL